MHRRERICPISGPGLLTRPQIERRAREIIARSRVDTVEYFEKCEALAQGTTFGQQAAWWINQIQSRKRRPIAPATTAGYRSYLKNRLNPILGDATLASVDNKTAKDLVARLTEGGLAPKTIVGIVAVLKAVLASAVNNDGGQMFPREWNHEYIDLPVVDPRKQHRPTLTSKQVTDVVEECYSLRRYISTTLAAFLKSFARNRSSGFLFHTESSERLSFARTEYPGTWRSFGSAMRTMTLRTSIPSN